MSKKQKSIQKENIIKLPITKHINTKFREYALYVLSNRGIPSFYDALTPVQRYILMNTPSTFVKTLTVIGRCIDDHYSHGDTALSSAVNKLTRPFGNSHQILDGYGFFGTEVSPDAAAPRYTSVKINNNINEILKKYKHLLTREIEGPYHPFWLDIPIGLLTTIVGISVGYKTVILPRKLEDINDFFNNKIKSIKPYFNNFNGTIKKYNKLDSSWLISALFYQENNKIKITDLPPLIKYSSVIKKLNKLSQEFCEVIRIVDNSNTKLNIEIFYRGKSKQEWENISERLKKYFSIIIKENIVFIKDEQVLIYDTIESYLIQYKWQKKRLEFNHLSYINKDLNEQLIFNKSKKEFIQFILSKKRTLNEINLFLDKYEQDLKYKLENITAKKFSIDELNKTTSLILQLTKELKISSKKIIILKKEFDKLDDPTLNMSIKNNQNTTIDLFNDDDVEEIDGITIWKNEIIIDDENENL